MQFSKLQRRNKFNDKAAPRHKHIYTVKAVAEIHTGAGYISRHQVLKCESCNSFYCIPREGTMSGLLEEWDAELPVVKLKTSHKWIVFSDLELMEE